MQDWEDVFLPAHSHESDWLFLYLLLYVAATGVRQNVLHRSDAEEAATGAVAPRRRRLYAWARRSAAATTARSSSSQASGSRAGVAARISSTRRPARSASVPPSFSRHAS